MNNNNSDNLIDLTGDDDHNGEHNDNPKSPQNKSTAATAASVGKKKQPVGNQTGKQQLAKKKKQQVKQQQQQKKTGKQPATRIQVQNQQPKQQQQRNQPQTQQQKRNHQPQQQQQQQTKKQPTPVIPSISTVTNAKRPTVINAVPRPHPPEPSLQQQQQPIDVDSCNDIVDLTGGDGSHGDHGNNKSGYMANVQNNNNNNNNHGREISFTSIRKNNKKTNNKSISFSHEQPPAVAATPAAAAATGKAQKNKPQKKNANPRHQVASVAAATGKTENNNIIRPGKRKRNDLQSVPSQTDQRNGPAIPRQPQQQRQPHRQNGQQGNYLHYCGQQHKEKDDHGAADIARSVVPSSRDHPTGPTSSESHFLAHNRPTPLPQIMDQPWNRHAIPRQPQQQQQEGKKLNNAAVAARHGTMSGQQHIIGKDHAIGADARGCAQHVDSSPNSFLFRPYSHIMHNQQMDPRKRPAIPRQEVRRPNSFSDRDAISRTFSQSEDPQQEQQRVTNHQHAAVDVASASAARGCASSSSNTLFLHHPENCMAQAKQPPPTQQQHRQEDGEHAAFTAAPRVFMPPNKGSYVSVLIHPPENTAQPPPRLVSQAENAEPALLRNEYYANDMSTARPDSPPAVLPPPGSLPGQRCVTEEQADEPLNQGKAGLTLEVASKNGHAGGGNHSVNQPDQEAVDRLRDEGKDIDSLVDAKSKMKKKRAKKRKRVRDQQKHQHHLHFLDNQARGEEIVGGHASRRSSYNNSVDHEVVCGITNVGNAVSTQLVSGRNQPQFPHVNTLDPASKNKNRLGYKLNNAATMLNAVNNITSLRDRFYGDQQRNPTAMSYGSRREDCHVPAPNGGHQRNDYAPPLKFQKVEHREGIALATDNICSPSEPSQATLLNANNNIANLRDRLYGNQQRHPASMVDDNRFYGNQQRHPVSMADDRAMEEGQMSLDRHHRRSDDSPPRKFQIVEHRGSVAIATKSQQPQKGRDLSLHEAEENRGRENAVKAAMSSTSPFLFNHHYYRRTAPWELTRVADPTRGESIQSVIVHHQQRLSATARKREKRKEKRRRWQQGEDLHQHHGESSTDLGGVQPQHLETSSPVATSNILDAEVPRENPGEMRVVQQVDCVLGETKQQKCDTDRRVQESKVPNPGDGGDIHQRECFKKNEESEPQEGRTFDLEDGSTQNIEGFHEVDGNTVDNTSCVKKDAETDSRVELSDLLEINRQENMKKSETVDRSVGVENSVDRWNLHAIDAKVVSPEASITVKATTAKPAETKIKATSPMLDETGDEEVACPSRNGESSESNEAKKGESVDKGNGVRSAVEADSVERSNFLAHVDDEDKEDIKTTDSKSNDVSIELALEPRDALTGTIELLNVPAKDTEEVVNERVPESDQLVPPVSTASLTNQRPDDDSSLHGINSLIKDSEKHVVFTTDFFGATTMPENAQGIVDLTKSDSTVTDIERLENTRFSAGELNEEQKSKERNLCNGTGNTQLEEQNNDGYDSDDDMTLVQLAVKMKRKARTAPPSSSHPVKVPNVINSDIVDDRNVESAPRSHFIASKDIKPLGGCDIDECAGDTADRSDVHTIDSADVGLKSHVGESGDEEYQQKIPNVTQVGRQVPTDTASETRLLPDKQIDCMEYIGGEMQDISKDHAAFAKKQVVPQHASSEGKCVEIPQEQGTEQAIENDSNTLGVIPCCLPDQPTGRAETKGDIINRNSCAPIASLGENRFDKKSHENGANDVTRPQNTQEITSILGTTPLEPRDSVEAVSAKEIAGTGQPQSDSFQDEEQQDENKAIKKKRCLPRKPVPKIINETISSLQNQDEQTAVENRADSAKTKDEPMAKVTSTETDHDGQQQSNNDGRSMNMPVTDGDIATSMTGDTPGSTIMIDDATKLVMQPKINKASDSAHSHATGGAGGQQEGTDTSATDNNDSTTVQGQSQAALEPVPMKKRFVPRKPKRSNELAETNVAEAETKARPRTQSTCSDVSSKAENKNPMSTTTASSSATKQSECNFVMIDSDPDDDNDDNESSVKQQQGTSKNRAGHPQARKGFQQAAPKKQYTPKPPSHGHIFHGKKYYNVNFLEEDAIKMQERMLKEAAERVRLLNLAREPSISRTPGIPVIENPIRNIEERYPDHWQWKDHYARLGLPHNANLKLVKSHWRHLARKYHPDKSKDTQTSAKFNAIAASFKKIANL